MVVLSVGQSLHYQNIWGNLLKLSDAIQSKVMSCQFHSLVFHQKPWYYVDDNIQHEIAASYHAFYTMVFQSHTIPGIEVSYHTRVSPTIPWYHLPHHHIATIYHTLTLPWHTIPWYCHFIPYPGIAISYHTLELPFHTIPWPYHNHGSVIQELS